MAGRTVANPEGKILMSQPHLSNHQEKKTALAGNLNKEVKMEWSTLGCSIRDTPAHCYSPEGGPADKVSPSNLHILSLILLLNFTGQLPAFFVVLKIKFTVVNENSQQC